MDLVKRLYEDKLITDDRSPAFSFDFAGREIDLVPPNYLFYIQVALVSKVFLLIESKLHPIHCLTI
jgi:hypothetical protein